MAEQAVLRLENSFVNHFKLIERRCIDTILNERNFNNTFDTERLSELGKMLGEDYVLIGTCSASVLPEQIKQKSKTRDDSSFRGEVSILIAAESELSFKLINVNSTIIEYSDTFHGDADDEAIKYAYREIRKKFPHQGRIVKIISPEEVMINLGSAYGARPRGQDSSMGRKNTLQGP